MKLLSLKKVHDGRYLKNYELTYENKAGRNKVYEIVSRKELHDTADLGRSTSGVSIIAFQGDKLLLLKEFRMGINKSVYNLCAGMLNEANPWKTVSGVSFMKKQVFPLKKSCRSFRHPIPQLQYRMSRQISRSWKQKVRSQADILPLMNRSGLPFIQRRSFGKCCRQRNFLPEASLPRISL